MLFATLPKFDEFLFYSFWPLSYPAPKTFPFFFTVAAIFVVVVVVAVARLLVVSYRIFLISQRPSRLRPCGFAGRHSNAGAAD